MLWIVPCNSTCSPLPAETNPQPNASCPVSSMSIDGDAGNEGRGERSTASGPGAGF